MNGIEFDGSNDVFRKFFMDKLATSGKIVINRVKEKWREYKGISGWKKHKEKFRSSISTGWYNLVKSAELMTRFILEKTSELVVDYETDAHS